MKKKLLVYVGIFAIIMVAIGIDTFTGDITEQRVIGDKKIAQQSLEKGIQIGIHFAVLESIEELQRTNMQGFNSEKVIKQAVLRYEKMKAKAIKKAKEDN